MYQYNAQDNIHEPLTQYEFGYKDVNATEERLYQLIRQATDKSLHSRELRSKANDWPTFYHLTPLRGNVVRPFRERISQGSVLELGAGCGAVTRYMGELGGQVTALEGSRSRARVIGTRCADLPNVKVVCDLIQNFEPEEKFDIVTLIGVLEYAQVYIDAADPIACLLGHARRFLKPGGLLLVAIENQLGLKYFAGSPEDHLGRPMFGINDSYGDKTPITFGRRELVARIQKAGFGSSLVYLPFPDYKTPVSMIYPAGYDLDQAPGEWNPGTIAAGSVVHDRQRTPSPVFSQEMAWHVVSRNGLIEDMANSFIIVASDAEAPILPEHAQHLASHYGGERPFELGKETQFLSQDGKVLARTHANATPEIDWKAEPYEAGVVWFDELQRILNRPNWSTGDLIAWARPWRDALLAQAASPQDLPTEAAFAHFPHQLPGKFIDATPTNWITRPDGSHAFIDLEWEVPFALPLEFILFRGIFLTIHRVTSCLAPTTDTPSNIGLLTMEVLQGLNVHISPEDMDNFLNLFNSFQNLASGSPDNALSSLTRAIQKAQLPARQIYSGPRQASAPSPKPTPSANIPDAKKNNGLQSEAMGTTATIEQIVRDYSIISPLKPQTLKPRGDSAAPKSMIFHILDDNAAPTEILDIGFGSGKLGTLVKSNPATAHWSVDGIDGFEANCHNPELIENKLYRNIWHGLAQELPIQWLRRYKIICLLDVVEHLPPETARGLLKDLLTHMADDAFLFVSTPLWFYPQDSKQDGDLEEHLIGVPATSMMALLPRMYSISPPLIGGFVLGKRSLAFVDFFQPTTDKSFSYEQGQLIAQAIGCLHPPGTVTRLW